MRSVKQQSPIVSYSMVTVDFSAWIRELSVLRKHWLLILLIVIGILWWQVFDLLAPPRDLSLIDADYWKIVTNPTLNWINPLGFIAIVVLILIQIRRISKNIFRLTSVSVIVLFCGTSVYSLLYEDGPNATLEHMMTIAYEGKSYHLAFYTYSRPWDVTYSTSYVLECNSSDHHCSVIYEGYGSREGSRLVVRDEKLFYEYSDQSWQILPKVNQAISG